MESTLSFRTSTSAGAAAPVTRVPIADDKAMLRAAAEMTRDLIAPRPRLYWADMVSSALVGYAALAVAVTAGSTGVIVAASVVSVLALYRALLFIHEAFGAAGLSHRLERVGRRAVVDAGLHV